MVSTMSTGSLSQEGGTLSDFYFLFHTCVDCLILQGVCKGLHIAKKITDEVTFIMGGKGKQKKKK